MKRVFLSGITLLGATLLAGCPIYPEDPYPCDTTGDCPDNMMCNQATSQCVWPPTQTGGGGGASGGKICYGPDGCGINETCGSDGRCHIGDCSFVGCVAGYACKVDQGVWSCVKPGGTGGAGGSAGAAGSAGAGGAAGAATGGAAGASTGGAAGASTGGAAGASTGGAAGASTGGAAGSGGQSDASSDTSSGGTAGSDAGADASSGGSGGSAGQGTDASGD